MNKIIVRTDKESYSKVKIGNIYKALFIKKHYAELNGGWSIKTNHYRLANNVEIKAFNKGIKNIKDIPAYMKESIMSYSIF